METFEAIKNRHSCRNYLPNKVTDEQIKMIVEAGRLAPSGKNSQPWKFVCVKTENESKEIANMLKNFYIKNKDNPELINEKNTVYATGRILEACPAIIFVFEDVKQKMNFEFEELSIALSMGTAVENMMLMATDMGLGNLCICDTNFVSKEICAFIRNKLKESGKNCFIDKSNRLLCALAIGYPAEPRYEKPRKPLDEILEIITY